MSRRIHLLMFVLFFSFPIQNALSQANLQPGQGFGTSQTNSNSLKKKSNTKTKPYFLSASVQTLMGTGSFTPQQRSLANLNQSPTQLNSGVLASLGPSGYNNHYIAQNMNFSLTYTIWKGIFASANWGFLLEYTDPDNAAGRKFFPNDVSMSLGWRNPIKTIRSVVQHNINMNVQLPTSYLAQVTSRLANASLGLSLAHTFFKRFTLLYGFGISNNFNRYKNAIMFKDEGNEDSIKYSSQKQKELEEANFPTDTLGLGMGRNLQWTLRNSFSLALKIFGSVYVNAAFSIINGFRYAYEIDEKTPYIRGYEDKTSRRGNTVGRLDLTISDLSFSYRPWKYISLALGASTFQTPFTQDNKSIRVPFLNLVNSNANYTTFYFAVTGSY